MTRRVYSGIARAMQVFFTYCCRRIDDLKSAYVGNVTFSGMNPIDHACREWRRNDVG